MLNRSLIRAYVDNINADVLKKNYVTFCFIAAIVCVYMLTDYVFLESKYSIIVNLGLDIHLASNPWATFTSALIHQDGKHLLGNMLIIGAAGIFLEPSLKTSRMLAAYCMALAAGDILEIIFIKPDTVVFGSSSIAYGLLGLVAIYKTRISDLLLWSVLVFVSADIIISLFAENDSNTAILSHIGGFAGGCIAGFIFTARDTENSRYKTACKIDLSSTSNYKDLLNKAETQTARISAYIVACSAFSIYMAAITISAARS